MDVAAIVGTTRSPLSGVLTHKLSVIAAPARGTSTLRARDKLPAIRVAVVAWGAEAVRKV